MTRILVVDDEASIRDVLAKALALDDYAVDLAEDGETALRLARATPYDLLITDLKMPGMDGIELQHRIKQIDQNIVTIIITAFAAVDTAIQALKDGAFDYVMKPFRSLEFLARVRSLLRRTVSGDLIFAGDIALDAQAMRVTVHGKPLALTRKEFEILSLLMRNLDNAVPRDVLLSALWHEPLPANSKSLDMHLSALRHKLDVAGSNEVVRTLRGVGFRLERQPRD